MARSQVSPEESSRVRRAWPWPRRALTGLCALALALSAYLSWHALAGGSMIGCGGGSPCDTVLGSRWSTVGGVLPVSGLAMGTYLAMLVASFFVGPGTEAEDRRLAWRALLVLGGAAVGSAIWFFVLQEWVVGSFCPYCMATHLSGVLAAALIFWQAPGGLKFEIRNSKFETNSKFELNSKFETNPNSENSPKSETNSEFESAESESPESESRKEISFGSFEFRISNLFRISSFEFRIFFLLGLTFAGALAAVQIAIAPPPVYLGGDSQAGLPALDPHAAPLVGSPDAPYVVTLLFDYACPHCQELHLMLDGLVRRYDGKLAFALCPAPLNSRCNPYVTRDIDEFKDSCDLARIALAVWKAKPEAFPAFDRWMFAFDAGDRWRARSVDAAREKAIELAGEANYKAALADPWIDRYLNDSIRIYGATMEGGRGGIPKLVYGPRWVVPQNYDADELVSIMQESLGVPEP